MIDPRTVGELDADTEVCRVGSGAVVHLPDTDCREVARREMASLRAGVLFGDERLCRYCRGVADFGGGTPGCHLPKTTEIPSDD